MGESISILQLKKKKITIVIYPSLLRQFRYIICQLRNIKNPKSGRMIKRKPLSDAQPKATLFVYDKHSQAP